MRQLVYLAASFEYLPFVHKYKALSRFIKIVIIAPVENPTGDAGQKTTSSQEKYTQAYTKTNSASFADA